MEPARVRDGCGHPNLGPWSHPKETPPTTRVWLHATQARAPAADAQRRRPSLVAWWAWALQIEFARERVNFTQIRTRPLPHSRRRLDSGPSGASDSRRSSPSCRRTADKDQCRVRCRLRGHSPHRCIAQCRCLTFEKNNQGVHSFERNNHSARSLTRETPAEHVGEELRGLAAGRQLSHSAQDDLVGVAVGDLDGALVQDLVGDAVELAPAARQALAVLELAKGLNKHALGDRETRERGRPWRARPCRRAPSEPRGPSGGRGSPRARGWPCGPGRR